MAVHPWIVPTIAELGMTSFLTMGLVDTKEDPTMELIKKELNGATSIRRAVRQGQSNIEALYDLTQTAIDPGSSSGGITGGVICDGKSYPASASAASRDYEHVGAQEKIKMFENTPCTGPPSHPYNGSSHPYSGPSHRSSPSCSYYKYKVCKDKEVKLLDKLEAITKATEELKSRRGVIPSTEGPPKKVDIFAVLGNEKKKELEEFIKMKDKYIDEILCVIRGRQLAYPDAYDAADRIMDLNFYNNFKNRYDEKSIKYVREKRPYSYGKSWTKAKRILAVMNVDVTYFLTFEIILYEENIKVYDFNLPMFSEKTFLTHMQPHSKLLPKLLT
ncbi:hypothetical protein P3S68_016036 [Capsicum galapagoense]